MACVSLYVYAEDQLVHWAHDSFVDKYYTGKAVFYTQGGICMVLTLEYVVRAIADDSPRAFIFSFASFVTVLTCFVMDLLPHWIRI